MPRSQNSPFWKFLDYRNPNQSKLTSNKVSYRKQIARQHIRGRPCKIFLKSIFSSPCTTWLLFLILWAERACPKMRQTLTRRHYVADHLETRYCTECVSSYLISSL